MYNPTIGRFIGNDVLRVDSLNRYLYVVNNPVVTIDLSGNLSRHILNTINLLYMQNILTDSQVAGIILMINVLGSSTQFEGDLKNYIDSNFDFEVFDIDTYEEGIRDKNVTLQSIYLSFHEISQVVGSKMIFDDKHFDRKKMNRWLNIPMLEYTVDFWGRKEADIVSGHYVWEVKPSHYSYHKFKTALDRYLYGGFEAGFIPETRTHETKIITTPLYGRINQQTLFKEKGHIGYCFNYEKGDAEQLPVVVAKAIKIEMDKLKAKSRQVALAMVALIVTFGEDFVSLGAGLANDPIAIEYARRSFAEWAAKYGELFYMFSFQ